MSTPFIHPVDLAHASTLASFRTPPIDPSPTDPSPTEPEPPAVAAAAARPSNAQQSFTPFSRPSGPLAKYDPPPPLTADQASQPPKLFAVAVQKEPVLIANNSHNLSDGDLKLRADRSMDTKTQLVESMGAKELATMASLAGSVAPDSDTSIVVQKAANVGAVEIQGNMSQCPLGKVCVKNPKPGQHLRVAMASRDTKALCVKKSWEMPVVSFSPLRQAGDGPATTKIVPPEKGGDWETNVYLTLRPEIAKGTTPSQKYKVIEGKRVKTTDFAFPIDDLKTHYVLIFIVVDEAYPLSSQMQSTLPVLKRKHGAEGLDPSVLPAKKRDDSDYKTLLKYLMDQSPEVARLVEAAKADKDAPTVPAGLFE